MLVLGDLCLDEYILGRAQRLSREAPVPVLEFQERFTVPGAACNPALNIQAAGGQAVVAGVVGDDSPGQQLIEALQRSGIDTFGVLVENGRPTTVKTRVLASHLFPQQLVRIDQQDRAPLRPRTRSRLREFLLETVPRVDAVLLSDYRNGVLDARLVAYLLPLAEKGRSLVTVDAQSDFAKFRGVSLFRCNREEAENFLGRRIRADGFGGAADALRRRLGARMAVITRGAEGMSFVDEHGEAGHIPAANPSEVYDVTGAGDTVIALLTVALAAGASLPDAAVLANYAAGLVVRRLGNATVTPEELAAAVREGEAG